MHFCYFGEARVERGSGCQHVMCVESWMDGTQSHQGADEQGGSDQQYQRQAHFSDHQQRTGSISMKAPADASSVRARGLERRNESERESSEETREHGKTEDSPVDRDV